MPVVEVPELGTNVHFPDGMSRDEMSKAIENLLSQRAANNGQLPPNGTINPQQPTAAPTPEPPETLTQRILRYGRTGAGIGLPIVGGIAGTLGGAATPVPGGALMGEMAGAAGGEYLAQKMGMSDPSNTQIGLAAAAPLGGRLVGAGLKALPVSKATAINRLASLLPAETSAALFGKAGQNALGPAELSPVIQKVINSSSKLGNTKVTAFEDVFDQLTAGNSVPFKEAETIKDTLQGYINHHSHFGSANYRPTIAEELKQIREVLVNQIDAANPGYKAALGAYGREQNVGRLERLISASQDPAKALSELRATPLSDLTTKNRLIMSGFDSSELDDIQSTLGRLSKSVSLKQWIESRLGGIALGGALGYESGGAKSAVGGALLGSMLVYPIGRRMINEMVKSGTINNPSVVSSVVQLFRATIARLPKAAQAPESSQQESVQPVQ